MRRCAARASPRCCCSTTSRAREAARRVQLEILGVAGVLAVARRAELVDAISPLLDSLVADGYLSPAVIQSALRLAGEDRADHPLDEGRERG
ncbi:MAG: hypothetical protein U1F67_15730 [Rubrivivax sp.]